VVGASREVVGVLDGDIGLELGSRVADALRASLGVDLLPAATVIRPSTRDGVDYQCNVAMGLAKQLGKPPREVAIAIVTALDAADLVAPPQVAGPGFINFALRDEWLAARTGDLRGDERLGVPAVAAPRRIAIDYSSPNVAKEMHVGHLRSTIIGDALSRLLRFAGHEVVPHNHLGDWGTPFGMLVEHMIDQGWTGEVAGSGATGPGIGDLNEFYQEARKKFDAEPDFSDRARLRVVALQSGDEPTHRLWNALVHESKLHFERVYDLLMIGLAEDDYHGESFYNPYLDDVVAELEAKGLTRMSDGALCVFPPGFANRTGDPLPLIVRKRDGGYNYAATDLATARYWALERDMDDLLYVVGTPQAQHFAMVFAVARQAGWLTGGKHAEHVGFGTILGPDGKTIRTRAGGTVKLIELLTEAIDRAAAVVAGRAELSESQRAEVARAVGVGAVKYADLCNDREKDYLFDWDAMLSMDGNTAVYLQYANARILSVLRRAGEPPAPGAAITLAGAPERALALRLLQFPAAVRAATDDLAPHKLCGYLYDTATAFSAFYERCPILADSTPPALRASRLHLAQLTSRTLVTGLSLLGIQTPERL
jgi:arginyl-tRNA synthetase